MYLGSCLFHPKRSSGVSLGPSNMMVLCSLSLQQQQQEQDKDQDVEVWEESTETLWGLDCHTNMKRALC